MPPLNLLRTTSQEQLEKLGFKPFCDSADNDPRDFYLELKIGRVTITLDAWFCVNTTVTSGIRVDLDNVNTLDEVNELIAYFKEIQNITD